MEFPHINSLHKRLLSMSESHRRFGALALYALVGGVPLYLWFSLGMVSATPVFPMDDAYITLHNALVFAGERSENFVDAARLSGTTSLLHTLFVAGLVRWMPPELALSVAGLLGVWAYAAALVVIGLRTGHRAVGASAIAFVGLASGYMLHQLANGLETSWAVAAAAWSICLAMDLRKHAVSRAIVLTAMPFIRPELMLLSILLSAYWLYSLRAERALARMAAALLAGFAGAWLVLAWTVEWLPLQSTASVKKYFYALGCLNFSIKNQVMMATLAPFVLPYGALLPGVAGWWRDRLGWVLAFFVIVFFVAYQRNFPGALALSEGRYLTLLAPVFVYGLARLLSPGERLGPRAAAAALALVFAYTLFVSLPMAIRQAEGSRDFTTRELMPLASWMQSNVDAGAVIMMHDVGYLGYVLRNPMVDLVGLKTGRAAEIHRQITWPSCGIRRPAAIARLVAGERPDYLVVLNSWDSGYLLSQGAAQVASLQSVWRSERGFTVYRLAYSGRR